MILKIPLLFEIFIKTGESVDHEDIREALISYFENNKKRDFEFRRDRLIINNSLEDLRIPKESMRAITKIELITRADALQKLK